MKAVQRAFGMHFRVYYFIFLRFFLCGPFLKTLEFATILLLFYVLAFWL